MQWVLKSLLIIGISLYVGIVAFVGIDTRPSGNPFSPSPVTEEVLGKDEAVAGKATSTQSVAVKEEPEQKSVAPATSLPKPKEQEPAISEPETITPAPPPPQPEISFDEINIAARSAAVNILCTTKTGGSVKPLSGSGMIIDPRGVILTNAHVAQYFLLESLVECTIRTGNPAYPAYSARLLYLPSQWIDENLTAITESDPTGTGEHDYAFLVVTGRLDSNQLPSSLPFLPLDLEESLDQGEPMLLVGYPAGFLGGIAISRELYQVSAITEVSTVYTYETGLVDLFSVSGTILSQKGASGGAAINGDKKISGIIVTSSEADNTKDRELRAVSIGHIKRSLAQTNKAIESLLSGDLMEASLQFMNTDGKELRQKLYNQILKSSN